MFAIFICLHCLLFSTVYTWCHFQLSGLFAIFNCLHYLLFSTVNTFCQFLLSTLFAIFQLSALFALFNCLHYLFSTGFTICHFKLSTLFSTLFAIFNCLHYLLFSTVNTFCDFQLFTPFAVFNYLHYLPFSTIFTIWYFQLSTLFDTFKLSSAKQIELIKCQPVELELLQIGNIMTNSTDLDQTPQHAASDLVLHYLQFSTVYTIFYFQLSSLFSIFNYLHYFQIALDQANCA